jgi:hypothetical protein
MTARFRIVHFSPDPFLGTRIPIAALLDVGGRVEVHSVPHIPGPECLGGSAAAAAVRMILEDLDDVEEFDRLPMSAGPHAVLDEPSDVPRGVNDAQRWLERTLQAVVPPKAADADAEEPHVVRARRRATIGYQFFQQHRVDRWVRKTFNPTRDADGILSAASALGTVSHFVPGDRTLLLMEPIFPRRAQVDADVQSIARMFGAYKTVLRAAKPKQAIELFAYVLPGGSAKRRDEINEELRLYVDRVVDTARDAPRKDFIRHIEETGESTARALG